MGSWREETRRERKGREREKEGGKSKQSLVNFPEGRPRAWLGRARGRANQKTALSTNQTAVTVSSSIDKMRLQNKGKEMRVCFALSEGGYREILTFICILYQRLERL